MIEGGEMSAHAGFFSPHVEVGTQKNLIKLENVEGQKQNLIQLKHNSYRPNQEHCIQSTCSINQRIQINHMHHFYCSAV